jgi:hypothetical protein
MSLIVHKTKSGWISGVEVVLEDGLVVSLDEGCYEDGGDWDYVDEKFDEYAEGTNPAVHPPGFKLVETTYKGREDAEEIALIKKLMGHPKAHHWQGLDADHDYVWRVWFLVNEADLDVVDD